MATPHDPSVSSPDLQSNSSAVSWSAVFAGATAAAALSLILLILGVGLGLSSVSPWAQSGVSAMSFGISTIVWLTFTQLIASGMGGYLAGRLRMRWAGVHIDEVYFRDTAHGFLAWAVASLATAALLTSTIVSILGGGVSATASVAGSAMQTAMTAAAGSASGSSNARSGASVTLDGQMVAQRTELSQQGAEKRIPETHAAAQARLQEAQTAAKVAADKARKASATAALWLFVSLLIGAFSASFAAIYGGRRRDL